MSAPGSTADTAPAIDILAYCTIHAAKCDDEGLHMRAIVLREASEEIKRLRAALTKAEA